MARPRKNSLPRTFWQRCWYGRQRIVAHVAATLHRGWSQMRRVLSDETPISIGVLVVDRRQRRAVARQLRAGLHRLLRVMGGSFGAGRLQIAVVVQQIIGNEQGQVAGRCHAEERPDGTRFALIQIALEVSGHHLTRDEMLAVLGEQVVGLLTRHDVLVGEVLASLPAGSGAGAGAAAGARQDSRPADPPANLTQPHLPAHPTQEATFLPDPLAPFRPSAPFIPAQSGESVGSPGASGQRGPPLPYPAAIPHIYGNGFPRNGNAT
jgi:hypothetical protein